MISKENEPIYSQPDGNYTIHVPGVGKYGVCDNNPKEKYTKIMVETYLSKHPEALIDEPKPPEPSAEEKAARKVLDDEAKAAALDKKWLDAWVREQRKKAEKNGGK